MNTDLLGDLKSWSPLTGGHGHSPYFISEYARTVGRAPVHSLVQLPVRATETTGRITGYGPIGGSDHDLISHHPGAWIGERIVVSGRLLDGSGRPVARNLVEIWQADAAGRSPDFAGHYDAPLDPHFTGAGRCVTDADGWYRFITIIPGSHPGDDQHDCGCPPHIHFSVMGRTFSQRLITRMYFPGDPLLNTDPVIQAVSEPHRRRLIGRPDPCIGQNGAARGYRFDIVLPDVPYTDRGADDPPAPDSGQTPAQSIGPFFARALLRPELHSATHNSDLNAIELTGAVYDGAARPIPHTMIETWQPDPDGIRMGYFTRNGTGSSGHYRLRTARPRRTPGSAIAPHLSLSLFAPGLNDRLATRVYLADDSYGNTTDPVLAALPADRRQTLLAHPEPSAPITRYRFDIMLQGIAETVFFGYGA